VLHHDLLEFGAAEKPSRLRSTATSRGSHGSGRSAASSCRISGWYAPTRGAIGQIEQERSVVECALASSSSGGQVANTVGRGHHEHRRGSLGPSRWQALASTRLAGSPIRCGLSPRSPLSISFDQSTARGCPSLRPRGIQSRCARFARGSPPDPGANRPTHIQPAAGIRPRLVGNRPWLSVDLPVPWGPTSSTSPGRGRP